MPKKFQFVLNILKTVGAPGGTRGGKCPPKLFSAPLGRKITFLVGLGKIFGRSVKNFGRPEQFLKVWKKIRNVQEKISEKMYGKKSRASKILVTRGREDFVKFYLATPPPKKKCVLPLKCPPKFRDLAPRLIEKSYKLIFPLFPICENL